MSSWDHMKGSDDTHSDAFIVQSYAAYFLSSMRYRYIQPKIPNKKLYVWICTSLEPTYFNWPLKNQSQIYRNMLPTYIVLEPDIERDI